MINEIVKSKYSNEEIANEINNELGKEVVTSNDVQLYINECKFVIIETREDLEDFVLNYIECMDD